MSTYRAKYTEQLPPTPCEPELRQDVVNFAKREGRSLADVTRTALRFFLDQNVGLADTNVSDAISPVEKKAS